MQQHKEMKDPKEAAMYLLIILYTENKFASAK